MFYLINLLWTEFLNIDISEISSFGQHFYYVSRPKSREDLLLLFPLLVSKKKVKTFFGTSRTLFGNQTLIYMVNYEFDRKRLLIE